MCGRFTLTPELKVLAERFSLHPTPTADYNPRFNIAPSQSVIVIGDDGARYMKVMKWGLIPSWAKDPNIGSRLKNLFTMAVRWNRVSKNPVKQVKLFSENNGRQRWLTLDEEAELLKNCDHQLKTLVMLALDTGFRASELRSLSWQSIDFQHGNIAVASGYTKNGEPRNNPMTRRLEEALRQWKAVCNGSELLFGSYRYRRPFVKARDAAGLGKDVCFHTLRHTYISRLILAGANIRTVQELAGHKTITMTMRYSHLGPAHKRQAVELLDAEVTAKVTTVDFRAGQEIVVNS